MDKDTFLKLIKPVVAKGMKQELIAKAAYRSENTVSEYVSGKAKTYTVNTMLSILRGATIVGKGISCDCKDIDAALALQLQETSI